MEPSSEPSGGREPMFNLPPVVAGVGLVLIAVHVLRDLAGRDFDRWSVVYFAFIPARYAHSGGGFIDEASRWWTPVSYFFLHASLEHLIINLLWFVIFGSAVAWRFGMGRFILFTLLTTAAGAGAHYLTHAEEYVPMVGASGGISGLTAAAARFVFASGGPLGAFRPQGRAAFLAPAPPLLTALAQPTALAFVAVWFCVTLLTGALGIAGIGAESQSIAWEAHVGGFLAGLVLFPLFDPIGRAHQAAS
jgi:membrane associated rhomboid family serine protease